MNHAFAAAWRHRRLWLLLLVALGLRLLLLPLPDPFQADLSTFWLPWMRYGAQHGLAQLYLHGEPVVNYPPLYLLLLVGLGKLYGGLIPDFAYTPLQSVLVKAPAVLADLVVAVLLYGAARRWLRPRADEPIALLAAALWALNPAILYVSAYWAQVDSLHTLWMLAALLAALARRWGWSGVLMGLALLTKLHAVVLLPLLLLLAWRNSRRAVLLGGLGLASTLLLGLLPLILQGAGREMLAAYVGAVGFYPRLSLNAFNGWFVVQSLAAQWLHRDLLDTARVLGPITLRWLGLGLLASYTALLLARLWPLVGQVTEDQPQPVLRYQSVFFAAGLLVFGFFSLATEMHERYGLPALAFLALPAARWRAVRLPYLLLTAAFSVNLLRVLPWGPGLLRLLEHIPADRLLVSLVNVMLFIWLTRLYLMGTRRSNPETY